MIYPFVDYLVILQTLSHLTFPVTLWKQYLSAPFHIRWEMSICSQAFLNLFESSFPYKNLTTNYKSASSGFKQVCRDVAGGEPPCMECIPWLLWSLIQQNGIFSFWCFCNKLNNPLSQLKKSRKKKEGRKINVHRTSMHRHIVCLTKKIAFCIGHSLVSYKSFRRSVGFINCS